MKFCRLTGLLFVLGVFSTPLSAAITWQVFYEDAADPGFFDPTFGQDRRDTLDAVLEYIGTDVLGETGTAQLFIMTSETDGGGGYLAQGGPIITDTGFQNGWLFDHVTTGIDPSVPFSDGVLTVDFGFNWNSDQSPVAVNEFDLFTVLLHELTHALGFASAILADGSSALMSGAYTVYDSFLVDANGNTLFDANANFIGDPNDLLGNVFFSGANAVAANGGNLVQVHTENPFDFGSSLSHLPQLPRTLMDPQTDQGESHRTYSDVERGILADLGWNLAGTVIPPQPVPEPSSLLLLIAGLGLLARRRMQEAI